MRIFLKKVFFWTGLVVTTGLQIVLAATLIVLAAGIINPAYAEEDGVKYANKGDSLFLRIGSNIEEPSAPVDKTQERMNKRLLAGIPAPKEPLKVQFRVGPPVSELAGKAKNEVLGFAGVVPDVENNEFSRVEVYAGYYGVLDSDDNAASDSYWGLSRIWFNREENRGMSIDLGMYVFGSISDGVYNTDGYDTDFDSSAIGFGASVKFHKKNKFEVVADLGYQFVEKNTDKVKLFGKFASEQEDDMLKIYLNYSDFRRRAAQKLLPKFSMDLTVEESLSDRYTGKWNGWNGVTIAGLDSYDPGKIGILVRQYLCDVWVGEKDRFSPGIDIGYDIYAEGDRDDSPIIGICLGWGRNGEEVLRVDYTKKMDDDEAEAFAIIGSLKF